MTRTPKQQEYSRRYYQAHKEDIKAYFRAWYGKNRERKLAYNRQYKLNHPDTVNTPEYNSAYYQAHKQELRRKHLAWYYKNRQKVLNKSKKETL